MITAKLKWVTIVFFISVLFAVTNLGKKIIPVKGADATKSWVNLFKSTRLKQKAWCALIFSKHHPERSVVPAWCAKDPVEATVTPLASLHVRITELRFHPIALAHASFWITCYLFVSVAKILILHG